jgi:hypothetical protein
VTQEDLERAAMLYEEAAAELERAVGHCRVAAEHFRGGLVPNGTAHAWAAYGHLLAARERLDGQARQHTAKAMLPGD